MKKIKLELAWEAVQDIYITHANIFAYRYGLKTLCTFGENTYLLKIAKKKIQAYYDVNEHMKAAELGLRDFLRREWRETFRNKSYVVLEEAKKFTEENHTNSNKLEKKELFDTIKKATQIHNDLFVMFAACQPQYTSLVEKFVKDRFPSSVPSEERDRDFLILTQSEKINPLLEEEIKWENLVKRLTERFPTQFPRPDEYKYEELEHHAWRYGLLGSADGLEPWTKNFLYKRLINKKEKLISRGEWNEQIQRTQKKKEKVVKDWHISSEVVELCNEIAELGHIRLCLRVLGWMPLSYLIVHELFPQLENYISYTTRQITCCVPTELFEIFEGNKTPTPEELDKRFDFIFYGLLDGEEVLWAGKKGEEMAEIFIPKIDITTTELRGQVGWKGKISGPCFVIHWDSDDILSQVDMMPEGSILIAGQTRPQLMPAIKKASAIVTDEGGLLSHAAIVSRELKKPSVIGTKYATKIFKTGDLLEVDADKGVVRILERKIS